MIRKRLEVTHNRENFSTLNLFCTWCVHTVITDSLTGLRTLVRVNNAVSKVIEKEKLGQLDGLIQDIVAAIGVKTLRAELIAFLDAVGIAHRFGEEEIWAAFMTHLIEIIRDTPIKFRPVAEIEAMSKWKGAAKIYKQIVETPFWRGRVPGLVEKRSGAFFRLVKCTTNAPPCRAATGGTRHGQGYQGRCAGA
jgi:hypothetical protein